MTANKNNLICCMLTMLSLIWGELGYAKPAPPFEFKGTPTTYSVAGVSIPIYPQAQITLPDGRLVDLCFSGKGLRQKRIGIIKVNAYVGIHYLENPAVLSIEDPMNSLSQTQYRMMVLQMMQNVNPEDIRAEFDDAMDANGVNLNSPELNALRKEITFSLKSGERAYFIGYRNPNDSFENLMVFTETKLINERGSTLVTDIWSGWFGIPVDREMAVFKKSLLSQAKKN